MQRLRYRCLLTLALLCSGQVLPAQTSPNRNPGVNVGPSTPPRVNLLIFDLTANGLRPSAVTVPEGTYLIQIRNGISLSELKIKLDHEAVPSVIAEVVRAGKGGLAKKLDLKKGRHTLTVGNRSLATATITVTAE